MKKLLAYLQLVRFPNVFTAIADILMGYFITVLFPKYQLGILIAASCSLYCAGMILNDVMDFDDDKAERPQRPLPSGRIDREWAHKLGYILLGVGILLASIVSLPSAGIAAVLAGAIYLYDGPLKRSALAPWVMGLCRALNALLGMSLAADVFQTHHLLIAGGMGTYVAGITWFARCEAKQSNVKLLQFGLGVMAAGIIMLALFPNFTDRPLHFRAPIPWPTLLLLLMTSVVRQCVTAIWQPEPRNVQAAVKHSLFSLVVLNAAIVLALCGPVLALVVVALIIPTVLLGKWVYST